MSTEHVESPVGNDKETAMTNAFKVGDPIVYFSEHTGYPKAGQVTHTHDSVDPESEFPRPEPGFAHIVAWSPRLGHFIQYADIPVRETAEAIPDYTMEGKLVGFFEVAR